MPTTRTPIRSSGRQPYLDAATDDDHPIASLGYAADPMSALRGWRDAATTYAAAPRRELTENVSWCGSCGSTDDGAGLTCCPTPAPVGCTLPRAVDGPRATADPKRTLSAVTNGAGARRWTGQPAAAATPDTRPDVTPPAMAHGSWSTRTQAKRPDGGKVVVSRLSVVGRARLALPTPQPRTAVYVPPLSPWRTRHGSVVVATRPAPHVDTYPVGTRNADGSTPQPRGAAAHRATARRRTRAAIVAAASPTAPADAALAADVAAMLAADSIG